MAAVSSAGVMLTATIGIAIFQDPEWQGNWRKSIDRRNGYGEYDDVHSRICAIEPCEDCEEQKEHRRWCNRGGW